jgi:uncharacterized Zn finger protein
MSDGGWEWAPYVSVAERRAKAARAVAKLRKQREDVSPVLIEGRSIAKTFWGQAWCDNLERYSDFASRMPRGRSYVRNGLVIDLRIGPGRIQALVSGSQLYKVEIKVRQVEKTCWKSICGDCAGAIDSVVELLQGRLSQAVMERVCRQTQGLFPSPKEIELSCSCPDWADMCKHVAAVLYGIGARLDEQPELLFRLRQVDEKELITQVEKKLSSVKSSPERRSSKVLASEDLAAMFGLELGPEEAGPSAAVAPKRAQLAQKKTAGKKKGAAQTKRSQATRARPSPRPSGERSKA